MTHLQPLSSHYTDLSGCCDTNTNDDIIDNNSVSPLQIGTYQMAMCSKAHNKPFYVVAESFKFVRLYPLNQQDVPDKFKVRQRRTRACEFPAFLYTHSPLLQYKADTLKSVKNLSEEHPMIDYTPPSLITLLFTDLGVLTPSAVSDELIKLYL